MNEDKQPELPELPPLDAEVQEEEVQEEEPQDELISKEAYAEFETKVKGLLTNYMTEIFEETKNDKEFVAENDMAFIESILGTFNAVINTITWDRLARNIHGTPITLVHKFELPDEEVEDGFKYGIAGVSFEYNELFKTEEERQQVINDSGMVVYNG